MDTASFSPSASAADDFVWSSESVQLLVLSPEGELLRWNGAAREGLGSHVELRSGRPVWELLSENAVALLRACMQQARTGPTRCLLTFSDAASFAFTLSCALHWADGACYLFGERRVEREIAMSAELSELTGELASMNRENAKLVAQLERTLKELRDSHWLIQRIQEYLPVCSVCHKVASGPREEGQWSTLVDFLAGNGLLMTHGYCPECHAAAMAEVERMPRVPPADR
jgi:PAS domain-containing protein